MPRYLSYRPPYDFAAIRAFLQARTIGGVEAIHGYCYRRSVRLEGNTGWVRVAFEPANDRVCIDWSETLAEFLPVILARVSHLFDLGCDPAQIGDVLGPLAAARPGLRVPGAWDGFEVAVRAILGQQVSVAAARTFAGRFAAAFGDPFPSEELTTCFPTPECIAACESEAISRLGILPARARTIHQLAEYLAGGTLSLTPGVDVAATVQKLQTIAGVGEWTAQYIAMRALAFSDAFPHKDLGVMKALGETRPKHVLAIGEAWRPWRAYATMHLWAAGHKPAQQR